MLTDACKSALFQSEVRAVTDWSTFLENMVISSPPAEKHMFAVEPYAVLARSFLLQKNEEKFLKYLYRLQEIPIETRGEFVLYDKDLLSEMLAAQKKDVVENYIESRFSFPESDQDLKKEYLKLLQEN